MLPSTHDPSESALPSLWCPPFPPQWSCAALLSQAASWLDPPSHSPWTGGAPHSRSSCLCPSSSPRHLPDCPARDAMRPPLWCLPWSLPWSTAPQASLARSGLRSNHAWWGPSGAFWGLSPDFGLTLWTSFRWLPWIARRWDSGSRGPHAWRCASQLAWALRCESLLWNGQVSRGWLCGNLCWSRQKSPISDSTATTYYRSRRCP